MEISAAKDANFLAEIRERLRNGIAGADVAQAPAMSGANGPLKLTELEEQLRFSQQIAGMIGEIPPSPPTLRARVGRMLIRVVQRMLFWYTPQIYAFNNLMVRIASEQLRVFNRISEQLIKLKAENAAMREELAAESGHRTTENAVLRDRLEAQIAGLRTQQDAESRQREALAQSVTALRQTVHEHQAEARGQYDLVESLKADSGAQAKYLSRIETLERMFAHARAELAGQSHRISVMLAEIRKRGSESLDAQQVQNIIDEEQHKTDALYVGFEDCFRGTREDIKDRVRVYLPWLKQASAGLNGRPVLDVGCGRGEWLELLRDEHLEAKGVDVNRTMVTECRTRGFDVAEDDVLRYLRTLPDASLGGLTGFHIIEHLPLSALIDLLDETVRVLKPGGLAIFETPNPANLLVGSYTFYFDPTHRNPLPSPTMAFLAEARGLCNIEILPLHPAAENAHFEENGSKLVRRLNEYFWGPQDYAMIGHKA